MSPFFPGVCQIAHLYLVPDTRTPVTACILHIQRPLIVLNPKHLLFSVCAPGAPDLWTSPFWASFLFSTARLTNLGTPFLGQLSHPSQRSLYFWCYSLLPGDRPPPVSIYTLPPCSHLSYIKDNLLLLSCCSAVLLLHLLTAQNASYLSCPCRIPLLIHCYASLYSVVTEHSA